MPNAQVVEAWVLAIVYLLDRQEMEEKYFASEHYQVITDYILGTGLTLLGKKGTTPSQTIGAMLRAKKLPSPDDATRNINVFDSRGGGYYSLNVALEKVYLEQLPEVIEARKILNTIKQAKKEKEQPQKTVADSMKLDQQTPVELPTKSVGCAFQNVYLGNFKAFSDTQKIPIRPLTLIFGPNSAGKSSFLHGLLYANEAVTNEDDGGLDVKRPRIGGDSVDLGGFRQFVHRHNTTNRVEWGIEIDTRKLKGRVAELLAPVESVLVTMQIGITQANVKLQSYELHTDGTVLLRASLKGKGEQLRMSLDELDDKNIVTQTVVEAIIAYQTTTEKLSDEDFITVEEALNNLVPDIELVCGHFLPESVKNARDSQNPGFNQPSFFAIGKGTRKEDIAETISYFLPRALDV